MTSEITLQETRECVPYESPSIIYEGEITTRAGTGPEGQYGEGVEPSDLFGNTD